MKSQVAFTDKDDSESCISAYCWWLTVTKFDECAKLKLDFLDISILAPSQ
ncbi:hypothetical protein PVK06_023690 [Gossypium arboreum]|uniref:Uncharacterized protein n=1 Tax=Gossypium arboreum TaxID=29729 RepID=A0ABR0PC16_GOSAR|nr:hypothetical protein PVK06_023690 [Gossypium arboreum]